MGGAFDEAARASVAPLLAFVTAFMRATYRGRRWKARLLEGTLLALATIGAAPVLKYMGLPPDLAIAFAVGAGYIGVDTLSDWIKRWGDRKASGQG
jgi:lambda family phage holin